LTDRLPGLANKKLRIDNFRFARSLGRNAGEGRRFMIARFKALSRNLACLELGENGGDRLAGLGDSSVVIVAEECRECSGDFVLCDGGDVGAFAERRGIGAEEGHPDVFRLRELLTV
jgi:hypothetical protein